MFEWEITQQGGKIEVYLNDGLNVSWDVDNPNHYKWLAHKMLEIECYRQVNKQTKVIIQIDGFDFIHTKTKTL